jgi:VWFA-related protein
VRSRFLLLLAPLALLVAQDDDTPVFHGGTELVDLHVSVLDKAGKLLTNIPQTAFKVFENNIQQPIKVFRREDVPVSMGIVVDNSGSMKDKRPSVAAAAIALVKASNPQDEEFVVNFNDTPYLDQPFTSDLKKLEAALNPVAKGGTAMRDAISGSIVEMHKAKHDKKVLVVITDGDDNYSRVGMDQLLHEVRQSEVLIYCIGLLSGEDSGDVRSAKKSLKALAEASGGFEYYPKNLSEVERITPQIAQEIRNQYSIGYQPTNPALDGTFRAIKVTVTGFGKPTVRARNGYYATAQPQSKPYGFTAK